MTERVESCESDKLDRYLKKYGGYWRYKGLKDFCYLINPFFPNKELVEEMRDNFDMLLREYPSGMAVNSQLAADMFGMKADNICVGNGTAELIKSLMECVGRVGLIYPTFEEYPNRKKKEDLEPFYVLSKDFSYGVDELMEFYVDKSIDALLIVNPDNPSGHFIQKEDILRLAVWCKNKGISLVVDESFVDFADIPEQTLLVQDIIERYDNLIVLKSISKSYGVPGVRLGVMASADKKLIENTKKDVSIWNINSYGEFFMEIIGKYRKEYVNALELFYRVRCEYVEELRNIGALTVYPTQANYVMCKINSDFSSRKLAEIMLNRYNILIKDLSGKEGFNAGNYIRLSVKTKEENALVIKALKEIL